jgi:hypothetical protein
MHISAWRAPELRAIQHARMPLARSLHWCVARVAIEDYIELFYYRERRHSTIGFVSPVDFEARYHQRVATVAA